MNWQERIVSDKEILFGKPSIKGTRLSVEFILGLLAQGWTEEQIFESYPRLTKDDILAIYTFVHDCMEEGLLKAKIV